MFPFRPTSLPWYREVPFWNHFGTIIFIINITIVLEQKIINRSFVIVLLAMLQTFKLTRINSRIRCCRCFWFSLWPTFSSNNALQRWVGNTFWNYLWLKNNTVSTRAYLWATVLGWRCRCIYFVWNFILWMFLVSQNDTE